MAQGAYSQGVYRLPETLADDLDAFQRMVAQFKDGSISAAQLQVFRVPQGVYEQRESGAFMLRVRLPAGMILPGQMRRLADVSTIYGNGILHVTTRQDIQVHRVPLDNIHPALVALAEVGLSTKGGGGNTVRNITACARSGVCPTEVFDVTPHCVAVTEFLLPDPLSYRLPRKYKLAFSGCGRDCAGATVNDLGFIARRRNGDEGFAVYVGGGMGNRSRVADLFEPFVPASDIFLIAEAVKRVFDAHGNRKNKRKARLRFLVERLGFDAFRELVDKELAALRQTPPTCPQVRPAPGGKPDGADGAATGDATAINSNVVPQKQAGYYLVRVPLVLGDMDAETLRRLADIVEACGEGVLRSTQSQNLAIRGVPETEVPDVLEGLAAIGLAPYTPPVLRDLVACTGASTCRLGICLSRGLAGAVADALAASDLDLGSLGELKIQISGCPNCCGRHPVAHVGLFGAARRVQGRLVPHYVVQLGGRVEAGKTRLAEGQQVVPARNVPAFLVDLLRAFAASEACPDFHAFLDGGGRALAEKLASDCSAVPSFDDDKNAYFDWGAEEVFSVAGRGPGECSAGVFDLIEVDLAGAAAALEAGRPVAAAGLVARALLVTRGEEAADTAEAFALFRKHFIDEGLVDSRFEAVVSAAAQSASASDPEAAFDVDPADVAALVGAVRDLYDRMDPSLRFAAPRETEADAASAEPSADAAPAVDETRDFRGVACPLNFVKTKLALDRMEAGQVLLVLLDEEGARNVPPSAANEGHEVLSVTQDGGHWQVLIRKG